MKKVLILITVAALSTSLWARRGQGEGPDKAYGPCMFSELNLTEKQQDQMIDLKRQHRDEMRELRQEKKKARFEMMKALEDNFNEDKARKIVDKVLAIEKKMMLSRVELIKSVKETLNDKQYKKMQLMRLWAPKGKRRGSGMRGNGRGFQNRD